MKWEKVRLGDVTDSCLGKMLDKEKNRGEYQLYLSNKDVRWGSFDLEHLDLMKFEEHEEERYGVRYGDLIVCEGGEPGRCAIWKNQIPNMKIQKALHRVRVHEDLDYRFLYYWFLWAGKRGELQQYFTGATIKHMPGDKLKSVIITKPDIETQRQIADVLSAYDDLIETNQNQIRLLEEAAQRLYKEWFIDLHFPGCEEVEIIDGVPEGWKKSPLGNVLQVVRGRSYSSKELSDKEGVLMVNLSNIRPYGGYNRDQEKHYTGKVNDNQYVETHDLLMGVTDMTQERRTVGRVAIVPNLHAKAMISMDLIKLVPVAGSPLFYYALLNYGGYSEVISRFANGTNVLHLRPDVLDIVDAVIPDVRLQNSFVEFFKSIQNRLDVLQDEMIIAAEARDRLLPKLMSGEIEL